MNILPQNNTPRKQCNVCKEFFPLTSEYFYRTKRSKDGLCSRCKPCKSKEDKAYREAHQEQISSYFVKYRELHSDRLKLRHDKYNFEHREQYKQYTEDNREKISEQRKRYHEEHGDHLRQYSSQYRRTERGKVLHRIAEHQRRTHKNNGSGTYTKEELYQQLQRQKNTCYYCHVKFINGRNDWQVDHIVPLSRGGSNDIGNIVIACPSCNYSKRNKMLHEWTKGGRLL